jgi:N-acetylglutamate synthase-like GNAT family acetyltransferase
LRLRKNGNANIFARRSRFVPAFFMDVRLKMNSLNSLRTLNRFYKLHKQNVSCSLIDQYFLFTNADKIVGAVIVRRYTMLETEFRLLRSLFVSPEQRRKGVATKLISQAVNSSDKPLYTLSRPELVSLYKTHGFECHENPADLPPLFINQIKKGLKLLCFKPSYNC